MEIYGLPQSLIGTETITIHQEQNGHLARCTMPLSEFMAFVVANLPSALSKSEPSTSGVAWNNNGVVSIS